MLPRVRDLRKFTSLHQMWRGTFSTVRFLSFGLSVEIYFLSLSMGEISPHLRVWNFHRCEYCTVEKSDRWKRAPSHLMETREFSHVADTWKYHIKFATCRWVEKKTAISKKQSKIRETWFYMVFCVYNLRKVCLGPDLWVKIQIPQFERWATLLIPGQVAFPFE